MYTYKKTLQPKNTIEVIVDIPIDDINNAYNEAFSCNQKIPLK